MSGERIEGVRATLRGRTLLVTGATGFVAKVFVAFLLDRVPELGRIVVLARGRPGRSAAARLQRMLERSPAFRALRERHGERLGAFLDGKLAVVEGDVRQPMLGLDARARAVLLPEIDCVVHVAGLTDFAPDPRDGIAVNVAGARHAAALAARTRGRRLLHVSTCFVAGQGSRVVPEELVVGRAPNGTRFDPEGELLAIESVCESIEERLRDDPAAALRERIEAGTRRALALGWPNLYTYTKGLAEHLLAMPLEAGAPQPAITIVRPSIVESARTYPFPGWNEGVNTSAPLVWLVGTMHRRMPFRGEHHFDVVPVDSVARGMVLALADALRDERGRGVRAVWQLASSDHNPLTLGRALDLTTLARRRQYEKSHDPFERFVLAHLDSVLSSRAPGDDLVLPAARAATRTMRDVLGAFDPEIHLPRALRARFGEALARRARQAGKVLGQASRTIGRIEQMLRSYRPFVWDDDLVFRTDAVRAATELLSEEERALFGFDVSEIDWRRYWLDVQVPGLDRWSLPALRFEPVPEDPEFTLDPPLRQVHESPAGQAERRSRPAPVRLGEEAE